MSSSKLDSSHVVAALGGALLAGALVFGALKKKKNPLYSIGDQTARFTAGKAAKSDRMLHIEKYYDASKFKGKRVMVTGANRGLGLAITEALVSAGASVIAVTRKKFDMAGVAQNISGVDVTSDAAMATLQKELAKTGAVDVLVSNAGYFYGPTERVTDDSLNFEEERKMIDICALGSLRVANALFNAKPTSLIKKGGKIALVTSQAGSIEWRQHQNSHGDNYGHHMSRAATNIMGVLLSFEMKTHGIAVNLLHPGFNRTEMTAKYKDIWDKEGAVEASVGAQRVLYEVDRLNLHSTHGQYINCEDGLQIPW